MKRFLADLHIHTALSPCAEDEMTPPAIIQRARYKGLAMIAICDHNTGGNTAAAKEAAGTAMTIIAGMEITTVEDIHVIGLFPNSKTAAEAGKIILATLPDLTDHSRRFGAQILLDAKGNVLGSEAKMLAASSRLTLLDSIQLIKQYNGLAVAAHVDRRAFSVISQLGMFPVDAHFDAIEISAAAVRTSRGSEFTAFGLPVLASSDSHFLSEIGTCCTTLDIVEPTFCELALALRELGGRRCYVA